MSLVLYHDSGCTQPVNAGNPDEVKQAVASGSNIEDVTQFWVKSDDATKTYENINITASGDVDGASASGEVDITYSTDNTTFSDSITLANGTFDTAVSFYRKVTAPSVTSPFNETVITHQITADKYAV